jgi:bifunctional NMN adenylyltransferase/nudix hydrolase
MQKRLTVFIGRFSPFHLGHEEVLLRALLSSEVVLLVIGSAHQARNTKNPFTGEERKQIVTNWYKRIKATLKQPIGTLDIALVQDQPYSDSKWILEVQKAVADTRSYYEIPDSWPNFLTGAERDKSTWYLKAFGSFFELDLVKESNVGFDYSATQLRDNLFQGKNAWEYRTPEETILFLDKWKKSEHYQALVEEYNFLQAYKKSWEAAPYPPTFITVDNCVIQSGHVLVVTRAAQPGKGLWALPGGFVEQNEALLDAAIRELEEETSIQLSTAQLYGSVKTKEVFDNPSRSLRGRTITVCYLLKLDDTKPLPKVKAQQGEVTKLQWMPIAEAVGNPINWFEDHHAMLTTMLGLAK